MENRGVSSSVGVVLMVAVTVILAAAVALLALSYQNSLGGPVQAAISEDEGELRIVNMGNSDVIIIRDDSGETELTNPGETYEPEGEYTVIGVNENGEENVLRSGSGTEVTEPEINLSATGPTTVSEGDTFQILGTVNTAYTVVDSTPSDSEVQITTSSSLSKNGFSSSAETFEQEFEATNTGSQDIIVTAETEKGDTETVTVTVTVEESFNPLTEAPDNSVTFTSTGETCQDVSSYNTAVITASAGQGGKTDTYALSKTLGGEGGELTVVADISDLTQLCGQAGQQGEADDTGGGYGGSGFTSGSKGGLNAGGGGGSTLVYDGSDPNNYAIAAGGGGGAGGEYFNYTIFGGFTTYPSKGGDGGSIGGSLGGSGGYGQGGEGSDGGVSAGPLSIKTVSSSTNEGDGSVTLELYTEES